jgi:hypothetical protein
VPTSGCVLWYYTLNAQLFLQPLPVPHIEHVFSPYARISHTGHKSWTCPELNLRYRGSRVQLKCDGTRAETRFRLSAKRTSPFKSVRASVRSTAEVCVSAVVMLDTPCSEVVWRVLATHSIRQFPLHFPSRASPCAITFQLEFTRSLYWLITRRQCGCVRVN